MSLFAALIALVGLASSVVGQRDERQREAASLRVTANIPRGVVASIEIPREIPAEDA